MAIRAIASDLDGTLLGADRQLSAGNERAIRAAMASGVTFVVATGRPLRWLRPLDSIMGLRSHVIASNGAITLDGAGSVLRMWPMDPGVLRGVQRELSSALPVGLAVEHVDGWARDSAFVREHPTQDEPLSTSDELPVEDVLKLLVWSGELDTVALHDAVVGLVGDRLTCTYSFVSAEGFLELSAPGVSKASALEHLLADLGHEPSELAAFGDMPNDLAMLRLAGRAFVPSNAHADLIAEGFEVIGHHDDDGVGRAIEALLR